MCRCEGLAMLEIGFSPVGIGATEGIKRVNLAKFGLAC